MIATEEKDVIRQMFEGIEVIICGLSYFLNILLFSFFYK